MRSFTRSIVAHHRRPRLTWLACSALCAGAVLGWGRGPAHGDRVLSVLAFGDSLTAGYGLARTAAFPHQLELALQARGLSVNVIDAGVSGDTTSGGLARLEWSLQDNPDVVLVALGANDGLRAIPPEETRRNLDAILGILVERKLPVLLAGIYAPRNLGPEYETAFNRIFPDLAEKHGVVLYPFILDGVALDPALNQGDGIHPNAAGVRVIVQRILPHVVAVLEQRAVPTEDTAS